MKIPEDPPNVKNINSNKQKRELLSEYLLNKEFLNFVEKVNDKYLYWDEIKYQNIPKRIDLEIAWLAIRFIRNFELKNIKISKTKNFTFKYTVLDKIQKKLHEFDLNLAGPLEDKSILPKEERAKSLISSTMEEAIASSILEGALTTRKDAKEMLRKGKTPKTIHEKMVLNNYETMKYVLNLRNTELSPDIISTIHKKMTHGTLEDQKYEGKFRDSNEFKLMDGLTGEIGYTPPDFKLLPELINDYCKFANNDSNGNFIHPIIKACILHFLMGYIHPFADGNGRTARSIFYWYVLSKGYWLFEYLSISRKIKDSPAQYARAYLHTEKDHNDLTYFINYHIKIIDEALDDLKSYMKKQISEKERITKIIQLKGYELNTRQMEVIKRINKHPNESITINEIMRMFDVVYETARSDLLDLAKKGFLEKAVIGKKKLLFVKSDEFEKIMKDRSYQKTLDS